ncbi:MAG: hypothetical protein WED34_08005 [Planctomycetales bacterium]
MESTVEQIGNADVLLRRVPPTSDAHETIRDRGDGEFRATSLVMRTNNDEDHLSCSLRRITSPRRLLDDLRIDGKDPDGISAGSSPPM